MGIMALCRNVRVCKWAYRRLWILIKKFFTLAPFAILILPQGKSEDNESDLRMNKEQEKLIGYDKGIVAKINLIKIIKNSIKRL